MTYKQWIAYITRHRKEILAMAPYVQKTTSGDLQVSCWHIENCSECVLSIHNINTTRDDYRCEQGIINAIAVLDTSLLLDTIL